MAVIIFFRLPSDADVDIMYEQKNIPNFLNSGISRGDNNDVTFKGTTIWSMHPCPIMLKYFRLSW